MPVVSRSALRAWVAVLSLCTLAACKGGEGEAPDVDFAVEERYAVGPADAALPAGAHEVSAEAFGARVADGGLVLAGPEAQREATAREAQQDAVDLATIREFERLNPDAQPLRPLVPVVGGGVRPQADGNLEVDVALNADAGSAPYLTLGERFRVRTVANALRVFPTKENQLATYARFYAELPESTRIELDLPPVDAASQRSAAELRQLNDGIAAQWADILARLPTPPVVVPPSCERDEGAGTAGDRSGNSATCRYSDLGLMKTYGFPGKEHVSCVKNQAARGTCPAFSSVSTMEWNVHKKLGRRVNLSEQALYARMKLTWGGGQTYGDGYWPVLGFNQSFAEGYVVPFETQWNYNPSNARRNVMTVGADGISGSTDDVLAGYASSCSSYPETCSESTHQTEYLCTRVVGRGQFCGYAFPDVNPSGQGFRVTSGTVSFWDPANRDLSVAKMILAVGLFGSPVVWGFDVQQSSWSPDANGFVRFVSGSETARIGGHAVHAVGVITNAQLAQVLPNATPGAGGGYFLVKNSWANCWGDAGFAYIPFDSVRAYSLEVSSAPGVQ